MTNRIMSSKRTGLVMCAASAALSFVLIAPRSARSASVVRTVSGYACVPRTPITGLTVTPGWNCGVQAGTDPDGNAMTGHLSRVYFDYLIISSKPQVRICVGKDSYSGSDYGDCSSPALPGSYPVSVENSVAAVNVKANPSIWDYVYLSFDAKADATYSNYVSKNIVLFGVGVSNSY
jgi:hypothetical protein